MHEPTTVLIGRNMNYAWDVNEANSGSLCALVGWVSVSMASDGCRAAAAVFEKGWSEVILLLLQLRRLHLHSSGFASGLSALSFHVSDPFKVRQPHLQCSLSSSSPFLWRGAGENDEEVRWHGWPSHASLNPLRLRLRCLILHLLRGEYRTNSDKQRHRTMACKTIHNNRMQNNKEQQRAKQWRPIECKRTEKNNRVQFWHTVFFEGLSNGLILNLRCCILIYLTSLCVVWGLKYYCDDEAHLLDMKVVEDGRGW